MAISKPRNRVVLFRLTQEEFVQVQEACTAGAARSVSDFARARILGLGNTSDGPSLAQLERRVAELTRAVTDLSRQVERNGGTRAEAVAAGFGPYLAKSGD